MSQDVLVPTDAGSMPALLCEPPAGRGPGIVLLQEIFGMSRYIRHRAQDLADLGYVVLTPTLYWRLPESGPIEGPDALAAGIARVGEFDWGSGVSDGQAAVRWLRDHSGVTGGVGLVGFCFGGGLAFNVAAVEPVTALVSYYGSALPGLLDLAPRVSAPSIHHFGLADAFIDNPTVDAIRSAVTAQPECEFWTYEGADHAFDNPDWTGHHPGASVEAWHRTEDFLRRRLPVSP